VGIGGDFLGRVDSRQAHIGVRERGEPLVTRTAAHHVADIVDDSRALLALRVLEGRVVRPADPLAEAGPELCLERAEREPLPVRCS
jgi:hypothetical protein